MNKPALVLLRVQGQGQADKALCADAGWQPLLMSPLRLKADEAAVALLAERWQAVDAVFWVSPGAVDMAAEQLPSLPPHVVSVAVGQATARRLAKYGVKPVLHPLLRSDSEAVLQLPFWQPAKQRRLLIVRGQDGRSLLADTLRQWGWQVDYAPIYRHQAVLIDWDAIRTQWRSGQLRAVYASSAALVEAWFAQMPADLCLPLKSLLYLSQHERIDEAWRQHAVLHRRCGDWPHLLSNTAMD